MFVVKSIEYVACLVCSHEIIEFPAVLLSVAHGAVVAEFHSLVRPVLNPLLSDFCRQLTGIEQVGGIQQLTSVPLALAKSGKCHPVAH